MFFNLIYFYHESNYTIRLLVLLHYKHMLNSQPRFFHKIIFDHFSLGGKSNSKRDISGVVLL